MRPGPSRRRRLPERRPLVYGLELRHGFALQFDPPSKCAALLHEGSIDVGMIPSIEYLRGPYHAVPDMAIVSEGPVASVAMFTTEPLHDIALDGRRHELAHVERAASRALLRSVRHRPEFVPMAPRPAEMLRRCDAALVIGDAALFFDHASRRRREDRPGRAVDEDERAAVHLGVLGRPAGGAESRPDLSCCSGQGCRRGASDAIARRCGPERRRGPRYLRENIRYDWGPRELEG